MLGGRGGQPFGIESQTGRERAAGTQSRKQSELPTNVPERPPLAWFAKYFDRCLLQDLWSDL